MHTEWAPRSLRHQTYCHSVFWTVRGSLTFTLLMLMLCAAARPQVSVATQHYDNARTGANMQETILTHANVNPAQFGKLFTQPLDGFEAGQPLYVPNVLIPATNSTHNVVYIATQHDSVYAFDADNNLGPNAAPLWQVNFLDPVNGITSVPVADEKCFISGYPEFGIQGTPVIDIGRQAIYVVAVTKENGNYVHRLHALNLGTGEEMFGGPVTMNAAVTLGGQTYTFVDKYQQQRPGLLLQNNTLYIGFGGPGCNIATEMGWVMAYNADTLQQVGAFNDSPGVMASAIWMSGAGPVGDGEGNVYFSTGDGLFDADIGGSHFGDSVLKLHQDYGALSLADYFTPYNQQFLNGQDLDVGSGQIVILPEQPSGKLTLAVGKDGTMYLLDQDNLGHFNSAGDIQIPQELAAPVLGEVHAGLTFWNNTIYLEAEQTPILAYSFVNGRVSNQPIMQTPSVNSTPKGGIVSSNGTQDGIFWFVTFATKKLYAYDASNLAIELYDNAKAGTRDTLGPLVHFGMPIVANGHLYVNGQSALTVFGLLSFFSPVGGNNQSGQTGTTLPIALQAGLRDAYSSQPIQSAGIPVTFSVAGNVGVFSTPNTTTDGTGVASTSYTLPTKPGTYTITASSPAYGSASFQVTAISNGATALAISGGNSQKVPVTTTLPTPLKVKAKDAAGNGVPGVAVTFTDGGAGGSFSAATVVTDANGFASTRYTTGTKSGAINITASAPGLTSAVFKETVLAGPAVSMAIYSGNNQTVKAGTVASKKLQVIVKDQYANPVSGVSVSYSDGGAGGSLSPDPATTNPKGIASTSYTAPLQVGPVTVTATVTGLSPATFTLNVN